MTVVRGRIWDKRRGTPLEARVQVIASSGEFRAPDQALRKVGSGEPFFYAGTPGFEVEVPGGPTQVVVERGTEYTPLRLALDAPRSGTVDVDAFLDRWIDLPEQGWYSGNTHVHYDETESRPLDRLRLDPRVEDLPVLVVSVLQRRDIPYASNVFPIGRHALSTDHHVIDIGEESRHNIEPWRIGLGHIMLLNIRELVEPIGVLVDDANPDYPPLVDACDNARTQGGFVLWCHNGNGMEAPIAAALGQLDGMNLFDPFWMDPEYDVWYGLLNCGIRLPASTGSDWFVCSSNRVYVSLQGNESFSYANWLAGLTAGRTLITNGPILKLQVEQYVPSNDVLDVGSGVRSVAATIEWQWHAPIDAIELICDGTVAATCSPGADETHGVWRTTIDADSGWIAARTRGQRRNSFGHAQWAHTSPVYLHARPHQDRVRTACAQFLEQIESASVWLARKARFDEAGQRERMLQLFAAGRSEYEALSSSASSR